MTVPSGWEAALKYPGANKQINRTIVNASHSIFPEVPGKDAIKADSHETLAHHERLSIALTEAFPSTIDEGGFAGSNGIAGDFYAINTVTGVRMSPVSVPLTDNTVIAETLGLARDFKSARHRAIFDSLFDHMFRTVQPANMSIRASASSGLPHCLSDVRLKQEQLVKVARNGRKIAALIRQNKIVELHSEFDVLNGAIMGLREQADTVVRNGNRWESKERLVNDALYAATGGAEGKRFPADKSFRKGDDIVQNHFAMRLRSIYAAAGWLNYFFTAIFTPLRSHYFSQYEFIWKHRSALDIEYKAQAFAHVVGVDVSQFDQSVQRWILDAWIERMAEVIDDDAIVMLKALMFAPFCQPDPEVKSDMKAEAKPLFFGDPYDATTWRNCPGLPSGVAPNPDLGKFIMVWTYLCLLDDKYHDVLEFGVDRILKGQHPMYAMLNMGDDNVFLTNDPSFNEWMINQTKTEKYYVSIGPEDGVAFLGNVFYRDLDGKIKVRPDGVTLVRNWLVPERGLPRATTKPGFAARSFHALGYFARLDHYQSAPSYGGIRAIWDEHHRNTYGESLDSRETYWRENGHFVPDFDAMSDADKLYTMNPAVIYYRLSEADVSETLLAKDRQSIDFEAYYPLTKQYYL